MHPYVASTDPSPMAEFVLPGVVSLVVALVVAVSGWLWNARQQRRARDTELFAAAYAALQAYKEFPYVIHRRDPDRPAQERVRISESLRAVQRDLAFHTAWLQLRSDRVSTAYSKLVAETKQVAGQLIHDRWQQPGIGSDEDVHAVDINQRLRELEPAEQAFLEEVRTALSWRRR